MLFHSVNSLSSGKDNRHATRLPSMSSEPKKTRRKPLEEWQKEDAARLKEIYEQRKGSMSQEEFAAAHGFGTQGAVWQYLNAYTPLNVDAAIRFARALRCKINDFSPTLSAMLMPIISDSLLGEPKPEYSVQKQELINGIAKLSDNELGLVQGAYEAAKQIHDNAELIANLKKKAG